MLTNLLDLVYPKICSTCNNHLVQQEHSICTSCEINLPYTGFEDFSDNPVTNLFWGKAQIEHGYSLLYFRKGGRTQHLLHELKYKGKTEIGEFMGERIGYQLKRQSKTFDAIIPVPLHPKKEKHRGYNQCTSIVHGINQHLNIAIDNKHFIRCLYNKSQTTKSRYDRFTNSEHMFSCTKQNIFSGQHILLVDDVITTGSTVNACINSLKQSNKDLRISVASIGVVF